MKVGVEPMVRVGIVALARDEAVVLECLGQQGVLELAGAGDGVEADGLGSGDFSLELDRLQILHRRVEQLCSSLGVEPDGGLGDALVRFGDGVGLEDGVRRAELEVRQVLGDRDALLEERRLWLEGMGALEGFEGLGMQLDGSGELGQLRYTAGVLPIGGVAMLPVKDGVVVIPVGLGRALVVGRRTGWEEAMGEMEAAGFEVLRWPVAVGERVDAWLMRGRRRLGELETGVRDCEGRLSGCAARFGRELGAWEVRLRREMVLLGARQQLLRTEHGVVIHGWVPAYAVDSLGKALRRVTRGHVQLDWGRAVAAGQRGVPVMTREPGWLRPFAGLVRAYGVPRYGELVPSVVLAVSFVLMFGLMFGDVGHGGVLVAAGWVVRRRFRGGRGRDGSVLLWANGVSSMVFGWVYGSVFGLPGCRSWALWRDPLEADPMLMMGGVLAFGVVLMSVGLGMNMVNRVRCGEWREVVMDKFGLAGLVFYWGCLLWVCVGREGGSGAYWAALAGVPVWACIAKEPLRLLGEGHSRVGEGMEILLESLVGAFEGILLYVANTLSFVRLAAYAMSHAALMVAAFSLAAEVEKVAGRTLGWGVILFGNLVALVLEGTVAAVQALRLEYYEFFGKFFHGDGRAFRPFVLGR